MNRICELSIQTQYSSLNIISIKTKPALNMAQEDRRACQRPMAAASSSIQLNLYALTTSLPENNSDICESWLDVIADTGFSDQFSK
jgi:hypothetical protein